MPAGNVDPEIFVRIDGIRPVRRERVWIDRGCVRVHDIGLIRVIVVAQPCIPIDFQKKDPAEPRTVAHPKLAVFVISDRRVDSIYVIDQISVSVQRITRGDRLAARHLCIIRLGKRAARDPREHHRPHVGPNPVEIVRDEQDDAGIIVRPVDGKIHAPFAHRLVPYDVGRPTIFDDRVLRQSGIRGFFGKHGIDICRNIEIVGETCPVYEIVRFCLCDLRSKHKVNLCPALSRLGIGFPLRILVSKHDGRIVHRNRTILRVLRIFICTRRKRKHADQDKRQTRREQ